MNVPSTCSIEVNINYFETIINQWLDCENDVDIDGSDINLESEHDTNYEISDRQIQTKVIQMTQQMDKVVHFIMEKINLNDYKNHFIVVILELYKTISK